MKTSSELGRGIRAVVAGCGDASASSLDGVGHCDGH
jgi:hypothetical protein